MAWKSLKAFNRSNLKDLVKLAKQRVGALSGDTRELKAQEGIGVAYFRGKLSVGYSTKLTDDRVDFYDLNDIESIMLKIKSKSIAKVEEILYSLILKGNYPVDLTQEGNLLKYVDDSLGIKVNTFNYKAVYVPQLQAISIAPYSPQLRVNDPIATIGYKKGSKCIHISVKDGLYNKKVKPIDVRNGFEDEVKLFNQSLDTALTKHKKDAVLHLLDGIKRVGLSVSYNYADDKVIIKDTDTGQVRLEGYVTYGKGHGTSYEYRFNYQEYYADGTPHTHLKLYRLKVTSQEMYLEAVEKFSYNL